VTADLENTSLESRAVVVTRAEPSDGPLSSELRNLGLRVLLWPAVSVSPAETGALDKALEHVEAFDWIVFASRHAVAAVTERVTAAPNGVRIAAIGQATAQVLRQRGWNVDLLPSEPNAAGLVAAFAAEDAAPVARGKTREKVCKGARILYPASSRALPTIAAGLSQLGAEVVQVEAYRTESDSSLDVEACRAGIARAAIGAVTFASPSAVEELERALGKEDFDRLLATAAAVAIGPTTARALSERGHAPVLAESATLHGLALTTLRLLQTRH
jgi:uroporphyrinogen III methyltransferase / synthase